MVQYKNIIIQDNGSITYEIQFPPISPYFVIYKDGILEENTREVLYRLITKTYSPDILSLLDV